MPLRGEWGENCPFFKTFSCADFDVSSCLRESSGTSPKVPKSSQPLSFLCSKSPELIQTSSPSVNLG